MGERAVWERPPGLHWQQVRRARGLTMPLPPKPRRPLAPPVLFGIDGHDIRTRADAVAAFGTWDAFLDRAAEVGVDLLDDLRSVGSEVTFFHAVTRLVPDAERLGVHREIRARMRVTCQRRYPGGVLIKETPSRDGSVMSRLFRRAS